ncbi:MAG: 4-phosphoerythronate dehydrogenase PdxB [Bacteroidales bacterium]|nr:4-phosphoerythronate dehydrogenase PdxB [Bacteroidales bacterium]
MKIVCDNKIPFLRGTLEPYAEVVYLPGAKTTPEVVRDADAIITRTRTICNEQLLKGSKVKVIATATIGYDHIDTHWCESNGIVWKNSPGCNSWSVKQYIASVLVCLAQKHGFRFQDMTLGVVGVGNVGGKVAEVASLMGFKVLLNDPPRARREGSQGFVSLEALLSKSDIVTVHVPLTAEGEDATWHLFDQKRLSTLRPDQILINSSRGEVVDNQALKAELKAGGLKAAVLDVWEGEPELDAELVGLLDITTPHIAGYSADGKANGTTMSVRTVAQYLGLPLTDWTASGVPAPAQPLEFSIDASGKTDQEVISEAILYTYDVRSDSDLLRGCLEGFEQQRGDYPVRREFTAFTLHLSHAGADLADRLAKIGFKIIQ